MYDEIKTLDYKGMSIKIYRDEDADSPACWDNPDSFLCSDYRDLYVDSECLSASDCREAIEETGRWFTNGFYIFPVCIYDHSGIALHLGECHGWDYSNGHAFVCVHRRKGWSWAKKEAEKIARSVIDLWNEYLHGEVYGYIAEDEHGEHIFSCGGFYGDSGLEDLVSDAKSQIDAEIEDRAEKETRAMRTALSRHIRKRKSQIRNHAPFYARTAFSWVSFYEN